MSKINWEHVSLGIITDSGLAKSSAMEALFASKRGEFDLADSNIKLAKEELSKASLTHSDVIAAEANGEKLEYKVLYLHAEDQLLSTETIITLVEELISMYKRFNK